MPFFWLLSQSYDEVVFGDSFTYTWFAHNYHDNEHLRELVIKMWPERKDTMFVPININNNHWILAVVNKCTKSINVYDSLKHKNTKEIKSCARSWIWCSIITKLG
jgi:Ulp1 family protease